MLYDIGAGEQLVARTQSDHHPPEISALPSVGNHMRPNVEMILGRNRTLSWRMQAADKRFLK